MHLRKGALRSFLLALALVALALPLSTQTASPVHAQINPPTSSVSGVASITQYSQGSTTPTDVAFNVLGYAHTAMFTCLSTTGCVDVVGSIVNDTNGTGTPITSSLCNSLPLIPTGSTAPCGPIDYNSTMTITFNPGAPDVYSLTFTGYVPSNGTTVINDVTVHTCPAGTGTGATATTGGASVYLTPLAAEAGYYCAFAVTAQKKYIEVTSLTPIGGPCSGAVVWSEALKAYLGPSCTIGFVATGTVEIKTVPACDASEPANGSTTTALQAEFGPNAKYVCTGNVLGVSGVAVPAGLPITLSLTNLGTPSGVTLGTSGSSFCLGSTAPATGVTVAAGSTTGNIVLCPTGFGPTAFSACIASTINTQTPVCSASVPGTFTLPAAARTIPYVKWAGEKTVLTKCFGGGGLMAGAAVEFTLKGNNPGLNATLLPLTAPGSGGAVTSATTDTIWGVTDARGCASAILYADGEGVAYVDAALFSTNTGAAGGTPIINEHAFEVFYMKFDHLDVENISASNQAGAATFSATSALPASELTLLAAAPGWPGIGGNSTLVQSISVPTLPGTGTAAGGTVSIPVCQTDYIRAMVHGYFEIPGDPSGRPAASVNIPGAPSGAVGSYVLPAGRWVLPEDWPVLATFAGFTSTGAPLTGTGTNSVYAWDINSGFAFNPTVEGAVLCTGPATAPASTQTGPITDFNTGPCFGYDVNGTPYSTAPALGCAGGETVGIGPFDITQACYNTGTTAHPVTGSGLAFAPAGSSVLAANTGTNNPATNPCFGQTATFCTVPTSQNSTYLPNGTLSQWDAPMPPAQITFVNTGSTGTLSEVNKSGFYSFTLASGKDSAGNPGYAFYYNPFYAEAIPSSPAIPPVTNNGGYLWNSWNFSGGTVLGQTTAAAFVAGESTTGGPFVAATCPPGFTAPVTGVCQTTSTAFTASECTAIGGTFNATPPALGSCTIVAPNPGAPAVGGLNVTNFGNCVDAFVNGALSVSPTTVTLQNASGFVAGETVEIYSSTTGATLANGLVVQSVNGNTVTFTASSVPSNVCVLAGQGVFIAQQFGVPAPGASSITGGMELTLYAGGKVASGTVNTTNPTITVGGTTYVLLNGAEAIAQALGGCFLSRGVGPFPGTAPQFGTCEPATLAPAGTMVTTGPTTGGSVPPTAAPPNPYPFWQWVPNAAPAGGATSGTMYSDNHGEAVVALNTPFSTLSQSISPVPAGGCPSGYTTTYNSAGAALGCILPLSALGTAAFGGFSNVATVNAAAAGTCFNTSSSGAATVAPTATGTAGPTIGANGPAAGQICKNSLGAIEFGAGAALGSTTIQAIAEYPYTRGEHPQISSGVLTKVFTSAFVKSVQLVGPAAGTPGPAGTTTFTVQITAKDVCGNAISAEPIQVYALGNAGSVVLAPVVTSGGTVIASSSNSAVVTVGSTGTATLSLEVLNTAVGTQGLVVKVVFPYENIERFVTVIPGTATTSFFQQSYGPGWNQVGGPAGSNFGVAEALFDYNTAAGTYTDVTGTSTAISSAPPNCTGYWAYFANAVTVNLPVTTNATPATCTVAKGWVLLGNPFTTPATLPAGVTAYHWNGTAYVVTNQIPVGGSVWVDNTAGTLTSVTLTP